MPLGEELIYLGPDPNITPTDLDWIMERAALRGHDAVGLHVVEAARGHQPQGGGTSEGVAVFLREALK